MAKQSITDTILKDGNVFGFDGGGSVYRHSFGGWRPQGKKLRSDRTREENIAALISSGWKRVKLPSQRTMEKWVQDGIAKTPCGCKVEPDGTCSHGKESWLIILGLI